MGYHSGELAVQRGAGRELQAAAVRRGVERSMSLAVREFLATQRMAVVASLDAAGRPWVSLLTGREGFLGGVDEGLLRIAAQPALDDPLVDNLQARSDVGLLVLDARTRRRVRINGDGLLAEDALFVVPEEVYGNCPKYIAKRRLVTVSSEPRHAASRSTTLSESQRRWLEGTDTLFLATFHAETGADASHRGGTPGFLRVLDDSLLELPDYPGNNMFNSLGNLVVYPRAGLLVVDFATGDLLQLTGSAEVQGTVERRVRFEIDEVLETKNASPLRWELVEPSPFNPVPGEDR